ncbi:MAG: PQQ-dependent sugar dehydrogenase, partial [Phycisphaerales bacterium]
NGGGDARIWSYGLRNPWRCTFDRETGDLWIADVGQNAWEEINFQPAGEGGQNYGWRCKEGDACTGLSGCSCSSPSLTNPIHVYAHNFNGGYSVSGGVVYRGCKIGGLPGTYFFADYVTGRIWSMRYDGTSVADFQLRTSELSPSLEGITVNQIVSFGEDATGEMYIVDQGSGSSGQIFRVIAADGSDACESGPIGDLNDDGVVNGADLGILLASWGACPPKGPCIADLNDDGVVNGADLGIQLGNWTG